MNSENFGYQIGKVLVSQKEYQMPIDIDANQEEIVKYAKDIQGLRINFINKIFRHKTSENTYSFDSTKPAGYFYFGKIRPYFLTSNKEEIRKGTILQYNVFSCGIRNSK